MLDVECEVSDIAAKWYSFGKALHLKPERLALLEASHGKDLMNSLSDTLLEFLRKNYAWEKHGRPSWRLIVIALAHKVGGNNTDLALSVAKEHPIKE